jgi:hypothetical protein
MKLFKSLILILGGIIILSSCQKELSVETGATFGGLAIGSIKDSSGNCLPISVVGTYKVDATLTDSSYVFVQVKVTTPGNYKIVSDSMNGYFFRDSGFFSTTGLQTIKLKAKGKPVAAIQSFFTIGYGIGFCSFTVAATSGGGGTTPIVPIGDYFPTTTGSNWSYTFNLTQDTLRFTVASTNTTVGVNSYRNFIVTDASNNDTALYRKGSGLYYEYGNIDFLGALDSVFNSIEFIFLKDIEVVGGTWESSEVGAKSGGVNGKAKLKFTILGKNVTKVVNGNNVDSVITVQRQIMFQPTGGNFSVFNTMIVSYAKNKGLLLIEGTLPPPLALPYRFEATRFEIK